MFITSYQLFKTVTYEFVNELKTDGKFELLQT